jgi:hypothetical protein
MATAIVTETLENLRHLTRFIPETTSYYFTLKIVSPRSTPTQENGIITIPQKNIQGQQNGHSHPSIPVEVGLRCDNYSPIFETVPKFLVGLASNSTIQIKGDAFSKVSIEFHY